jgi:hypothetical protein
MSTSHDRLGEMRTKLLPHIIRHLAERSDYKTTAELSLAAIQSFDRALTAAEFFHSQHQDEDPDLHLAHLMQVFHEQAGVPHLQSLPVIEEFVLPPKQKPAAN